MADLAYSAVILAGGVTLVAEATRQFSKPMDANAHERYPILRGLELSSLSTPAEYLRGYVLYNLVYLLIFAAFLISTELFDLLQATAPGKKIAGATGNISIGADQSNLLSTEGYGKPIFISAAIIFALSSGIFSTVEGWIRTFAHWLAGIPRGVYRVITKLNQIDYQSIAHTNMLPLTRAFETNLKAEEYDELQKPMIEEANTALTIIDLISPSVIGQFKDQLWPGESVNTIDNLVESQRASIASLKEKLPLLSENPDSLEEFHQLALENKNNTQALFAVLFIRNKNIALQSTHNPTAKIINSLRERKSDPILQSLAGAILFSMILSIITYAAIYVVNEHLNQLAAHMRLPAAEQPEWTFYMSFQEYIAAGLTDAVSSSFKIAAMFAVATSLAAFTRENQIEVGNWQTWQSRQTPYLRFLIGSLLPAAAASLVYAGLTFVEEAVLVYSGTGTLITSGQISDFIRNGGGFYMMTIAFGLLASFYLFVVVDVHHRLPALKIVLIGVLFSVLFLIWAVIAVSVTYGSSIQNDVVRYIVKEALYFSSFAFYFFIIFAALIKWAEETHAENS